MDGQVDTVECNSSFSNNNLTTAQIACKHWCTVQNKGDRCCKLMCNNDAQTHATNQTQFGNVLQFMLVSMSVATIPCGFLSCCLVRNMNKRLGWHANFNKRCVVLENIFHFHCFAVVACQSAAVSV